MLTREQNERLSRIGPGTPCGNLLRRYWQVLCPVAELTAAKPKKRVRILGEDLVLFRSAEGPLVCIEEHCSHRNVSLYRGFIEEGGIRCCYHGWKFDCSGKCVERPFETTAPPPAADLRTYPVETLGGLAFVYMGPPEKRPPLPRWDVLARRDRPKHILTMPIHDCNWLQIQENTVDSVHSYYLHASMANIEGVKLQGGFSAFYSRKIVAYDWRPCKWGVEKVLQYNGAPEVEIRPPLIFPNILRIPEGSREAIHFRIPVDDEHTRIVHVDLLPAGSQPIVPDDETPFEYQEDPDWGDDSVLDTFYRQDRVAWETQGVIADRTREVLGASDRGIVIYRRQLAEQIDLVEAGKDPTVAVVPPGEAHETIDFSQAALDRDWPEYKFHTIWTNEKEPVA